MWYQIIAGMGIGLAGSFHCVGMCGPLALSIPFRGDTLAERVAQIVMYNLGRAATYALLGAFAGLLGGGALLLGFQKYLSLALGVLILLCLLLPRLAQKIAPGVRFPGYELVQRALAKRFQAQPHWYSFFVTGMLNGLLPCGLVYLGLAAATATGAPLPAAALMFFFGLGTFPLMLGFLIFGQSIPVHWRLKMRKAVPVFVFFTAVILIWRGYSVHEARPATHELPRVECHKISLR
ncbi:sulfite exporter TauE/SafE family protein [Rurimicrobium arvi]|uniref:Sulfite exporter TauE/SafE family protein n=1 Tax=Rurimicrobium arvi TaxID=2049916 RepID=A0ABP8MKA2_9BACT